jgi:hypothetical protein
VRHAVPRSLSKSLSLPSFRQLQKKPVRVLAPSVHARYCLAPSHAEPSGFERVIFGILGGLEEKRVSEALRSFGRFRGSGTGWAEVEQKPPWTCESRGQGEATIKLDRLFK